MEKKVMNKENRFLTSLTGKANKQIEKIKFSGPEASWQDSVMWQSKRTKGAGSVGCAHHLARVPGAQWLPRQDLLREEWEGVTEKVAGCNCGEASQRGGEALTTS